MTELLPIFFKKIFMYQRDYTVPNSRTHNATQCNQVGGTAETAGDDDAIKRAHVRSIIFHD
jgi:hypothetical protein